MGNSKKCPGCSNMVSQLYRCPKCYQVQCPNCCKDAPVYTKDTMYCGFCKINENDEKEKAKIRLVEWDY